MIDKYNKGDKFRVETEHEKGEYEVAGIQRLQSGTLIIHIDVLSGNINPAPFMELSEFDQRSTRIL